MCARKEEGREQASELFCPSSECRATAPRKLSGSQTKASLFCPGPLYSTEGEVHKSPGHSSGCTKQLHRSRFSINLIQKL